MSSITACVCDARRSVYTSVTPEAAEVLLAALAADPDTLPELEQAFKRFSRHRPAKLRHWTKGRCDLKEGVLAIDVSARTILLHQCGMTPAHDGVVEGQDLGNRVERISFHLSPKWEFFDCSEVYVERSEFQRASRASRADVDVRKVLYQQVIQFIIEQCRRAQPMSIGSSWHRPVDWQFRELGNRLSNAGEVTVADAVAEIHARWLMSPRRDLRGRTPRDVLVDGYEHINSDVHDRERQWSLAGNCPPGLRTSDHAYRFGGFGIGEVTVYYHLLRRLIFECWASMVESRGALTEEASVDASDATGRGETSVKTGVALVEHLERWKDQWLASPNADLFSGLTPGQVVQRERLRIPVAVTGEQAMVDCDCPLCQMMAEDTGPYFLMFDGTDFEPAYPFSCCSTYDEWESEQAMMDEWSEEAYSNSDRSVSSVAASTGQVASGGAMSIASTPDLQILSLGFLVSAFVCDLRADEKTALFVEAVNSHFGNLRSVIRDGQDELIASVIQCWCDELDAIRDCSPGLVGKCDELIERLSEFMPKESGV